MPFCVIAQKEKVFFTKIGIEDGLSQNQVYSMSQDNDGYIWVCTSYGLGKYDGNHFENYYHIEKDSTSIPSHIVYKYLEDSKGRCYVATFKGFAEFNKKKGTFITYRNSEFKNSLSDNSSNDILEIEDGRIAIATNKGVDLFNPITKNFTNHHHSEFKAGSFAPSLLYDSNKQLWVAAKGLFKVVNNEKELKYYPLINKDGKALKFFDILQDSFGTIWLATTRGLYTFDPVLEKFKLINYKQKEKPSLVKALLEYPKGHLYIGTRQGLYHYNIKEEQIISTYSYSINNPEGISVDVVMSLMKDRDKNIWIGLFRGINIINPEEEQFKLRYNTTGLNNPENAILDLYSDSKNRLWTNTSKGFFVKENSYSESKEVTLPSSFSRGYKDIVEIFEDENKEVWIVFSNGNIFKTTNQSSNFTQVENGNIFNKSVLKDAIVDVTNSNNTWFATSKGICKYNRITKDTTWVRPNQKDSLKSNNVIALTQQENENIWFISNKSLCKYNVENGKIQYFNSKENDSIPWSSRGAFNIEAVKDRVYLSGYSFSYFDIKNEKFTINNKYKTPVNLNRVVSIVEADNGTIWFVNQEAVLEYNPKTDFINYFNVFNKCGGFITNSKGKSLDGKLLFGSYNGVLEIDVEKINTSKPPAKVVLSNFKISNKIHLLDVKTQYVKDITLQSKDNIFSIEFTALQFTNQQVLNYRYKLEGFDEDWLYVKNKNEATYTNLDPGNYSFVAEAINPQGLKSKEPLLLSIYIKPNFWQTNLFSILLFFSISLIIFLIYKNRKKVLQLKQEKLVAQQSAIYKSKFLANMSHEFRTPMNAIMGLNKLMIATNLTDKQQEFTKGIDLSCENLLWIINDILDQSKIESGKMTIRNIPFSIKDVVDQISLLLKIKMNEKDLNFKVDLDPKIPNNLIGDSTRIFQILTNLIGNAIKFTEKGSINLRVTLAEISNQRATLLFEVVDTGIGIPKNKINEIFKSFEQLYNHQNEKYYSEGTGLGLSISKELVEQMGGEIYLESEVNVGSKFYFDLNFEISKEKKSSKEIMKELILPENLSILLVEDTPINRFLVIELIKQNLRNATIDIAENGKIALTKIESQKYDLVLMDIKMPVMDGLEATKLIRAKKDAYFKTVPILGLTANAISQQIEEAKTAGMNACITKPIFLPELLSCIDSVLKNKNL